VPNLEALSNGPKEVLRDFEAEAVMKKPEIAQLPARRDPYALG